nr:glycosyltransferase family 9 protein [Noviherbaspirillum autotrophicum]
MAIKCSHILICRTDNIGDVVLTLPICTWLKKKFPQVKISIMCRAYAAAIVRRSTAVDAVIELESVSHDLVTFFACSDIDTVIFAQPDQQLAVAAFKAGIPNRIGNARQKVHQLLFCNRRVRFSKRISDLHESQFNFEFLRPLGLKTIPELSEIAALYRFSSCDDEQIRRLLRPHPFNLIIHMKSNGHGREWPMENFFALAQQLRSNPSIHIWVTGSAEEGQWIERNASELLRLPNVSNVCGKFTLDQLATFIQMADGLIASGTGPLHMAAALGQRTLGLFPPTRPMHPGRWAPVGRHAQALYMPTSCLGCADKQTISCDCMKNIAPDVVAEIVLQWRREQQEGNCATNESMYTRPAKDSQPALFTRAANA